MTDYVVTQFDAVPEARPGHENFAHAWHKLQRADKHIRDAKRRIRKAQISPTMNLIRDGNTQKRSLICIPADHGIRIDLALIVGDAIHNMACALDMAWMGWLQRHREELSKYSKLPGSHQGVGHLQSILSSNYRIEAGSAMYQLLINDAKPYPGGDRDILALRDLDIRDKHKLLLPLLTLTNIEGVELARMDGEVDKLDFTFDDEVLQIADSSSWSRLRHPGTVRINATFRDGGPLGGDEVLGSLRRIHSRVDGLVSSIMATPEN